MKKVITCLIFDDFETLDLFGVVEVFGRLPDIYHCQFVSLKGGLITSSQNVQIHTQSIKDDLLSTDILLIVGGKGTIVKTELYQATFNTILKRIKIA